MVAVIAVRNFWLIMFPVNSCEPISFFDSGISSNWLNKNVFKALLAGFPDDGNG